MFSGEVEKVLGMTAAEVGKAYEEDKSALAEIANNANFKRFVFKCRAKYEMYNVSVQFCYVGCKKSNNKIFLG